MLKDKITEIVKSLSKRFVVSNILVSSFFVVILVGTLLLCLPISQRNEITVLDAAFTSVSATCVTGLMTINNFADLTVFGEVVVLIMIQIGGLGLMSFISLFLMALNNKLDFSNRYIIKDMLSKDSFEGISMVGALIFFSKSKSDLQDNIANSKTRYTQVFLII